MQKQSIDELLAGKKSKYSLVMGVAKRAREIADIADLNGEELLEKPVNLAAEDFKAGKYELYEPEITN